MNRYLLLLIPSLALLFSLQTTVSANWTYPHQNPNNTNSTTEQPELPYRYEQSLPNQYIEPIVENGNIITAQSDGQTRNIVSYALASGEERWRFSLGTSYPRQPIIHGTTIYFGLSTKPTVLALDLTTGSLRWQSVLPNDRLTRYAPVVIGDQLFVVGDELHRFNRHTGAYGWSRHYDIASPVATDNYNLFFRTHHQQVISLHPETGTETWAYFTNTTDGTHPVVVDNHLYVGLYQQFVTLDSKTGKELWKHDLPPSHPHIGSISATGQAVFFGTNNGDIYRFSPDGQLLWQHQYNSGSYQGNGWQGQFIMAGEHIITRFNQLQTLVMDGKTHEHLFAGQHAVSGLTPVAVTDQRVIFTKDTTIYIFTAASWVYSQSPTPTVTPSPTHSPTPSPPSPAPTQIPVIVIPGLLESWPLFGSWQIDPFLGIFHTLLTALTEAGYPVHTALFTFGYDWHQSNTVTGELLKQRIADIKQKTGTDKVDLITHSMGGLVARSYIQSNDYAGDVRNLVTIAAPHHGSVAAYLTWETGEVGKTLIDRLLEKFIQYEATQAGYKTDVVRYIHEKIPALGELLPVFNYLANTNDTLGDYLPCSTIIYPCNPFLEQLTQSLDSLIDRVSHTTIIGQTDQHATLKQLTVAKSDVWPHGVPLDNKTIYGSGDNTVLLSSASLRGATEYIINANHTDIVSKAVPTIIRTLTGKETLTATPNLTHRLLFIKLFSPIDMIVTDNTGRRSGTDPITQQLVNEIPSAYYSGNQESGEYLIIPNPEGVYDLSVIGTGEGEYRIETSLLSDGDSIDSSITGTTRLSHTAHYRVDTVKERDQLSNASNDKSPVSTAIQTMVDETVANPHSPMPTAVPPELAPIQSAPQAPKITTSSAATPTRSNIPTQTTAPIQSPSPRHAIAIQPLVKAAKTAISKTKEIPMAYYFITLVIGISFGALVYWYIGRL